MEQVTANNFALQSIFDKLLNSDNWGGEKEITHILLCDILGNNVYKQLFYIPIENRSEICSCNQVQKIHHWKYATHVPACMSRTR